MIQSFLGLMHGRGKRAVNTEQKDGEFLRRKIPAQNERQFDTVSFEHPQIYSAFTESAAFKVSGTASHTVSPAARQIVNLSPVL